MRVGLTIVLLASSAIAAEAETARGTVFEDRDADGARDTGEPGIPRVRVSDGRQVVVTDEDGRYSLEIGDEAIVFITKPSGYATPVNAQMLPRFYYVHQPHGSPDGLRYAGIAPTGPLPDRIDFPMLPCVQLPGRYRP